MKKIIFLFTLATLILFNKCAYTKNEQKAQIIVTDLLCSYRENPIGVGNKNPNLSWKVNSSIRGEKTTAYQIIVATEKSLLDEKKANIWNTQKVQYLNNEEILFKGEELLSSQKYYWKIRVWGKENQVSEWSEIAFWEMALLNQDDWKAKWIVRNSPEIFRDEDFYREIPAPVFRKEFVLKDIESARLYISGLGYYEAFLNGARVGDHQLDPGWTSYNKRILYSSYDVTELLNEGNNAIGVIIGNGWFNPLPLRMWGTFNLRNDFDIIGSPTLIAQLVVEYKNGSRELIVTDNSWKVGNSPILKNNIYLGEVYDTRKEIPGWNKANFDDTDWENAIIPKTQFKNLMAQSQPPVRITKTINAIALTQPKPGIYIYDMGQNYAGWIKFTTHGKSGTKIKFRYGELTYPDGTLNGLTSVVGQIKEPKKGGPGAPDIAWQRDEFILNGNGKQSFSNHFSYHGFRYVEITGLEIEPVLEDIKGFRLNTDVSSTGSFSCSNEMFNKLYNVINWTFISNLYSVQSDCPTRERFGYGGDMVPVSEAYIHSFDMSSTYTKIVRDFSDAVRMNNGITETAPFIKGMDTGGLGGGSGPIGWGIAHPFLLEKMYRYYGNKELVIEQYRYSKNWLDFLAKQADKYIIYQGIGDHESIDPAQTELVNTRETPITSTAFFYDAALCISRLAKIIDKQEDFEKYTLLAEKIKKAYSEHLMIGQSGKFGLGTQTHQSFALYYDLVPEQYKQLAFQALIDTITLKHNKHLSTGIFGTKFILDLLTNNEEGNLAYEIVNNRTFPGWGYMLENNATTLWEHWDFSDNIFSHNHSMFGSVAQWMVGSLAGIQIASEAIGYDKIIIKPEIIGNLTWAKASYNSVNGITISSWKLTGDNLKLKVEIPVNSTAIIHIPCSHINLLFEDNKKLQESSDIELLKFEKGRAIVSVGSGKYSFNSNYVKDL